MDIEIKAANVTAKEFYQQTGHKIFVLFYIFVQHSWPSHSHWGWKRRGLIHSFTLRERGEEDPELTRFFKFFFGVGRGGGVPRFFLLRLLPSKTDAYIVVDMPKRVISDSLNSKKSSPVYLPWCSSVSKRVVWGNWFGIISPQNNGHGSFNASSHLHMCRLQMGLARNSLRFHYCHNFIRDAQLPHVVGQRVAFESSQLCSR